MKPSLFIFLFCFGFCIHAQVPAGIPTNGLQVFWPFSGNANDASGNNRNGRVYGATLVKDRFGNENGAYNFNGSSDYISTTYPGILGSKPRAISFWAVVSDSVRAFPAISWGENSQFPENGGRFDACFSGGDGFGANKKKLLKPRTRNGRGASAGVSDAFFTYELQHNIYNGTWHHYVFQFEKGLVKDIDIYQDGKLLTHEVFSFYPENPVNTVFSSNVQIGRMAIPEECCYFSGALDDIMIYDRVLSVDEIEALYEAPDPVKKQNTTKIIFIILTIIALILLVAVIVRFSVRKFVAIEKEKNRLKNQWYEQENRVLKAQMDPHFVFNSLNTIQQFIIAEDNEKAQRYLSKFSRLIRTMLESSSEQNISLKDEKELYERYLEIESLRFDNVFDYEIIFPDDLDLSTTFIPHFLVQPFIENAIYHGLLPKIGYKELDIIFQRIDEKILSCTVEDNGIGRKNAAASPKQEIPGKNKRLGISFVIQRLLMMSKMDKLDYHLEIIDKEDTEGNSTGTKIVIYMPIVQQN